MHIWTWERARVIFLEIKMVTQIKTTQKCWTVEERAFLIKEYRELIILLCQSIVHHHH